MNEASKDSLFLPLPDRPMSNTLKCVMTSQNPLGFQLSFPATMLSSPNTNIHMPNKNQCQSKNCPCTSQAISREPSGTIDKAFMKNNTNSNNNDNPYCTNTGSFTQHAQLISANTTGVDS
jgi:hypothetical protein